VSVLLRMASSEVGTEGSAPPSEAAEGEAAPPEAAPEAAGEPAAAAKRGPACAPFGPRGDGPFFGPAMGDAVSAQLLLTAAIVLILSVAGDAHGSATKARGAARRARAAPPDARPRMRRA
jgi:hypothetical protein